MFDMVPILCQESLLMSLKPISLVCYDDSHQGEINSDYIEYT
jgi:hypothetical protein